ncbi:hypothetical protein AARAC_009432 [Aspergillus arachidicola]|uniref:Uncharacterized protein n=1 Tax=Aspergillus arachidicola TaxID=656916 RepID=A0A2G7FQM3_9EURO|nr:hypothetical protein AARAC_009432 [Aspergillus arachidicola]
MRDPPVSSSDYASNSTYFQDEKDRLAFEMTSNRNHNPEDLTSELREYLYGNEGHSAAAVFVSRRLSCAVEVYVDILVWVSAAATAGSYDANCAAATCIPKSGQFGPECIVAKKFR